MSTIYDLKPRFQHLLRPLTRALHRLGVTANSITLTAASASILYGGWMLLEPTRPTAFLLLPLFMLVRMALNAIDGMIARDFQQQTKLGAILNETGDVVSDAALYLPFAFLPGVHAAAVVAVVFFSVLSEFVGVLGQIVGGERRYDGPLGKSDRAFVFGTLGLAVALHPAALPYLNPALLVMTVLLGWTALNRGRHALRSTR
jgi:CDP-diacylglycerol--glycerol-3-phosphate 3-phosphatidyltransferase